MHGAGAAHDWRNRHFEAHPRQARPIAPTGARAASPGLDSPAFPRQQPARRQLSRQRLLTSACSPAPPRARFPARNNPGGTARRHCPAALPGGTVSAQFLRHSSEGVIPRAPPRRHSSCSTVPAARFRPPSPAAPPRRHGRGSSAVAAQPWRSAVALGSGGCSGGGYSGGGCSGGGCSGGGCGSGWLWQRLVAAIAQALAERAERRWRSCRRSSC